MSQASALSHSEVERLVQLVDTLRQSKRSIIYISHFLEEIMRVADRVTVLRDGKKVATLQKQATNVNHLISLMLGHEVDATLPADRQRGENPNAAGRGSPELGCVHGH